MISLMVGAMLSAAAPTAPAVVGVRTQTFRSIIRVPREPEEREPRTWREERGPACIGADAIVGAKVRSDRVLDIILDDRRRVRAQLEPRCTLTEFERGFYLRPGRDGMVCAARNSVRARSGQQCEIDRFDALIPDRPPRSRGRR